MSISFKLGAQAGSLACALLFAAGAARAGSFSVRPTFVQLQPDVLTATVDISNTGSQPLIVEVAAYDWSQDEDEDFLMAPTADLVAVPPVVTIDPAARQTLRVGLLRPPPGPGERGWRLVLTEVPEEISSHNGVSIALEFNIPVFYTPAGAEPIFSWTLERRTEAGGLELGLQNSGSSHLRILGLQLLAKADGESIATVEKGGYLLPGTHRRWPVTPRRPLDGGTVLVRAQTDRGTVEAELKVP